jgi:hypothetical protein
MPGVDLIAMRNESSGRLKRISRLSVLVWWLDDDQAGLAKMMVRSDQKSAQGLERHNRKPWSGIGG